MVTQQQLFCECTSTRRPCKITGKGGPDFPMFVIQICHLNLQSNQFKLKLYAEAKRWPLRKVARTLPSSAKTNDFEGINV